MQFSPPRHPQGDGRIWIEFQRAIGKFSGARGIRLQIENCIRSHPKDIAVVSAEFYRARSQGQPCFRLRFEVLRPALSDKLRTAIPNVSLTTDVIVGFPGESEADFAETLSAAEAIGFDEAYTFKFSLRDGTPATRFPASDTVSDEVASDRLARLIATVRGVRSRCSFMTTESRARSHSKICCGPAKR